MPSRGRIIRVAGPVVQAEGMLHASMHELVEVGEKQLVGEVIRLQEGIATIQVYQNTTGLKLKEEVVGRGAPLSVELGPGLVGNIFDGIQRPLEVLKEQSGPFIKHGFAAPALSKEKEWFFKPTAKTGEKVIGGDVLGTVEETMLIQHKIMVPPNINGKLTEIAKEGNYRIKETVAVVQTNFEKVEVSMLHEWPVRNPRPYKTRLLPFAPLVTGQRVIDTFFPIAKGGQLRFPADSGLARRLLSSNLPSGLMHN